MSSLLRAVLYREVLMIKKNVGEYVVLQFLSLFFAMAIMGVAYSTSYVASRNLFLEKFSQIFGISSKVSFTTVLLSLIVLSGLVSVVADVVGTVSQIVIYESNLAEVIYIITQCTSLSKYYAAYALVAGTVSILVSTVYVPICLACLSGLKGILTYLYVLPIYIICGISLAYYTLCLSIPMAYIMRTRRHWVMSQTLVPALIAGSGIFIPVNLVPIFLRIIAYTSPLPEICTVLQKILLKNSIMVPMIILFTILMSIYVFISLTLAYKAESIVRRGL